MASSRMVTVSSLEIARLVMIRCTLIALSTNASIGILLITRYAYLFDLVSSASIRAQVVIVALAR